MVAVNPSSIEAPPADAPHTRIVAGSIQAFISLEGVVDIDVERERIGRAIGEAEATIAQSDQKLANPEFVAKAPAEVVAEQRAKIEAAQARLEKLQTQLEELG